MFTFGFPFQRAHLIWPIWTLRQMTRERNAEILVSNDAYAGVLRGRTSHSALDVSTCARTEQLTVLRDRGAPANNHTLTSNIAFALDISRVGSD